MGLAGGSERGPVLGVRDDPQQMDQLATILSKIYAKAGKIEDKLNKDFTKNKATYPLDPKEYEEERVVLENAGRQLLQVTFPRALALDLAPFANQAIDLALRLTPAPEQATVDLSASKLEDTIKEFGLLRRRVGQVYVTEFFNEMFLAKTKAGWALEFDRLLEGYLPEKEDRDKVLEQIQARDDLRAWADENNRVLYVVDARGWARGLSIAAIFIVLLLGLGTLLFPGAERIASVSGQVSPTPVSPTFTKDLGLQTIFYGLTVAGFVMHLAKKYFEPRKDNTALSDIWLWLHISYARFLQQALLQILVFYTVLLAGVTDAFTFFATGYFIDSTSALILGQYASRVQEARKNVEKLLKKEEEKPKATEAVSSR